MLLDYTLASIGFRSGREVLAIPTHDPSFRFCPVCGDALAPRVVRSAEPERPVCASCGFIHYLDPKVAVGTIVRAPGDRLVMLRRAIEPGYGLWVFPGGYVDRGEELHRAALREAKEEAGIDVRLDGLVNVYSYAGRAPVIVVYAATALGTEIRPDEESLEARLFTADEIPWDRLAFRSTREALEDYLAGLLHPRLAVPRS